VAHRRHLGIISAAAHQRRHLARSASYHRRASLSIGGGSAKSGGWPQLGEKRIAHQLAAWRSAASAYRQPRNRGSGIMARRGGGGIIFGAANNGGSWRAARHQRGGSASSQLYLGSASYAAARKRLARVARRRRRSSARRRGVNKCRQLSASRLGGVIGIAASLAWRRRSSSAWRHRGA